MENFTRETLFDRLDALPAHVVYAQLMGREDWGLRMAEMIPAHMREGFIVYVALGVRPGDFLDNLLSNDLMGAFGRADSTNLACMEGWVRFLYNYAPVGCYGSAEAVDNWLDTGGTIGRREAREAV